jgi:NAD(P)-dependent dehydrogenase (short-subunit alcohol dehydrogenase family)
MKRWTAKDIPTQTGRTAIVTGANTGIGYDAAAVLAARGAQVVLACRSRAKAERAVEKILRARPEAGVSAMVLDLASLASVESFAEQFRSRYSKLDLLINNAGVMMPPLTFTEDGFELQMGTNHLGHFALTGRLLDLLLATPGSRVVTVSSLMHRRGRIDFQNLKAEKSYSRTGAYSQSKLANLLFALELQRRLLAVGAQVLSTAAHPGWTQTDLQRYNAGFRFFGFFLAQRPAQGALPTLRAATDPNAKGADYYGPDGFMEMKGCPVPATISQRARNEELARKLWEVSEELTGVRYPDGSDTPI